MTNKCNEWNCSHNKDGICDTDECIKDEEDCTNCTYYLHDYWNCQGQEKVCHEYIKI